MKLLAAALLSFFTLAPNPAHSATYYVSPSGNDANNGLSLSAPFRTVYQGVARAAAGDTVLIRGGTYREEVPMPKGGSAGNYITVAAYGSEVPVLKGSDVVTGWVQHSGAIWKKTGWTVRAQQVFVDFDSKPGKPLVQIGMPSTYYGTFQYPAPVGTGLTSMTAGTFFYDPAATTLYVWLPDGSSPNSHVMEVSKRQRIFFMAQPYVHLKGLHFRHTNSSTFVQQSSAIEMSSNSIVEDCDVQYVDFSGIGLGYLTSNTQAINNNISNNGAVGISAPGTTSFIVRGNKLNGNNYRNFNPLWHAGGIKAAAKAYGTVESNEAAGNNGSGIWFDNASSGGAITVRNNYVHDNGPKEAGIFIEVTSNAKIYNNVIANNQRRGIYVSASNNNQVMNNTISGTSGYAGLEVNGMPRTGATLTNNTVYNNIITGSTGLYDLVIAAPSGTTVANNKSNYNNIYRPGGVLKMMSSSLVSTLGAWSLATGQDYNSLSADPAFVGTGSAANYALRDGSPVIDKGVALTGVVTTDYLAVARPVGGAYDIGAFEKVPASGTTTPPPTTDPTPTPTPTTSGDGTPPLVTILGPANGSTVAGTIVVSGSATDNKGVTVMAITIDGVKKATSASGSISYAWSTTGLRAGTHSIRISASDAAGNLGSANASVVIN